MKLIRVRQMPEGEASEGVRADWVGCIFSADGPKRVSGVGVLTGDGKYRDKFYIVGRNDAMNALEANGKHETADWWGSLPNKKSPFLFRQEECEEVMPG